MFSAIKNGQLAQRSFVVIPQTKISVPFLNILWDEGYILGFKISGNKRKKLKIFLNYNNEKPAINCLKTITKPGHRVYFTNKQLWKIKPVMGLVVVSTPFGFLSLSMCKKLNLGGEPYILIM